MLDFARGAVLLPVPTFMLHVSFNGHITIFDMYNVL